MAPSGRAARKRATLIVLALTDLMVVLDTTVVYVALPSIQRALGFSSTSELQWVVNAYVLAFGGFVLLGGGVADRFGRRVVFVSGVFGFVASSLVCGLASSPGILIAARAVQGLWHRLAHGGGGGPIRCPAAEAPKLLPRWPALPRVRGCGDSSSLPCCFCVLRSRRHCWYEAKWRNRLPKPSPLQRPIRLQSNH